MSLTEIWHQSREQLVDKHIQQIMKFAGDGKLRDGTATSEEFREFLSYVPSSVLRTYAQQCLQETFDDSGYVLQDIVNQAGKRLGFDVAYGRYRGVQSEIGNDGVWLLPDGRGIVVEVKTSDTFRVDLETVSGYRNQLADEGVLSEGTSSILIVVGREDTGGLESQIRGSRYAWDVRLISVDALMQLVDLKERVDDPRIIRQIYDILIPQEFTKLDKIVNIIFSTAEDIEWGDWEREDEDPAAPTPQRSSSRSRPSTFHDLVKVRVEDHLETFLLRRTRTIYSTPDETSVVAAVLVSKYHEGSGPQFWYSFHPHQKQFLAEGDTGYLALGCGDPDMIILLPLADLNPWLDEVTTSERNGRLIWHLRVQQFDEGVYLVTKRDSENIDLSAYLLP